MSAASLRLSIVLVFALASSLLGSERGTNPSRCGDDADAALFSVASWRQLAVYWERYPGCDDGYFGEHISELVGGWLSERPTTLARLTSASARYPALIPLVLRHIDTIASADTVSRIRENVDRRCPGGSERVCQQILARLNELDREIAIAQSPGIEQKIPVDDPSDPRLRLQAGQVAIEYIAHSCFRIHTARGARLLIDPFASHLWLGYDFPHRLAADAVLITHPHYDHDADVLIGHQPPPWASDVRVLRDPGVYRLSGVTVTGIRGKHADPWGKEFGQTNTIWLLELDGLRIAHIGDNGPLTDENLRQLGRVDILMLPVDAKYHILKEAEIEAIRKALRPRVLIPMHYRLPDLERSANSPEGLGEIDPWLAGRNNVVKLESNVARFTAGSLLPSQVVAVFPHSAKVSTARVPLP